MEKAIRSYIENGSYGDLDLSYSLYPSLTSLPDNLRVGGKLFLRNSAIKYLPKNLQVDGTLNDLNTNLE